MSVNDIIAIHERAIALPLPGARSPISIRLATERDLKFIDALQKQHGKMVGFASTQELLSHVHHQTALVADDETGTAIGYCLYRDRYMKREDCGCVSQLNVAPDKHRGLVGAALVKAVFERVPYGVRLFCCWCAQDLEANHFWEALGFVPLAFRSGSRGKAQGGRRKETRMHIFWQRRVREGDAYSYWFPSQTTGGRMGEARLVLPIPPGTHWSDAMPALLPGAGVLPGMENVNALPTGSEGEKPTRGRERRVKKPKAPALSASCMVTNGLRFGPLAEVKAEQPKPPKRLREKQPKQKNDPKYVAAARELRDRYLEQVNSGAERMLPAAHGKYDVSRQLEAAPSTLKQMPLLKAA